MFQPQLPPVAVLDLAGQRAFQNDDETCSHLDLGPWLTMAAGCATTGGGTEMRWPFVAGGSEPGGFNHEDPGWDFSPEMIHGE